ncbi:MAG: TSUP family transporter, partial [Fluviibacter sp.]
MIDSIVGGGGLILVPALFATYPTASPATLLGTNKCASVWGTSLATYQYSKRVQLAWRALLPAALFALAGSFAGAWSVTQIDPAFIRKLMPFILLVVLIYTLVKKDLGANHKPHTNKNRERVIACLIGAVIGWYDGFFGPGTGSFFIFLFVRFLGYDFL